MKDNLILRAFHHPFSITHIKDMFNGFFLASLINPQVLTIIMSASSGESIISYPFSSKTPAANSLSLKFFGHPSVSIKTFYSSSNFSFISLSSSSDKRTCLGLAPSCALTIPLASISSTILAALL